MNKILNIISGETLISLMKDANIPGNFLPWQDFLHEGSVPYGLSLEALSKIRAEFITNKGLGNYDEIYQSFKDRNAQLNAFKKYDKIILWFEDDLYDQLQLIQILDWFAKYSSNSKVLSLISTNQYLSLATHQELQELLLYQKEPVTHNHLIVARKAWSAFTSPTPQAWMKLLNDDISALPFLKDATIRMLEEYPNNINGLSRTAHQALLIISNGETLPEHIFQKYQQSEPKSFMGDVLFFDILNTFVSTDILKSSHEHLTITPLGERLLKGEENWLHIHPIDYWLGGVHQTKENLWCWDIQTKRVSKYRLSKNRVSLLAVL